MWHSVSSKNYQSIVENDFGQGELAACVADKLVPSQSWTHKSHIRDEPQTHQSRRVLHKICRHLDNDSIYHFNLEIALQQIQQRNFVRKEITLTTNAEETSSERITLRIWGESQHPENDAVIKSIAYVEKFYWDLVTKYNHKSKS